MARTNGDSKPRRRPGARRRAREIALAALYRADLLGLTDSQALASVHDVLAIQIETWPQEDRTVPHIREEAVEYAIRIIDGVCRQRARLDASIDGLADRWSLDRQAVTDRTILRIALWELGQTQQPEAVVINEAVEIATEYGGPDSHRFVNGILGARQRESRERPDSRPEIEHP